MPFYRCTMYEDSGGGGGGIYSFNSDDYLYFIINNVKKSVDPILLNNKVTGAHGPAGVINLHNTSTFFTLNLNTLQCQYLNISNINEINSVHFGKNIRSLGGISSSKLTGNAGFNAPIYFDEECIMSQFTSFISGCSEYNLRLDLPKSSKYCGGMFGSCFAFNQPMLFSKNTNQLNSTFFRCNGFNQPVVIESNIITDFQSMFVNASNMYSNIIFTHSENMNYNFSLAAACNCLNRMLDTQNHGERINIFAENLSIFTNSNIYLVNSTVGVLTWSATTNGYYNSLYNIYVLNNVNDALDAFNSYYYNLYGGYPVYDN